MEGFMKIGILYIATGKYSCFWQGFYESCEKFFIKDADKHYFVFTDADNIHGENITVIPKRCQGFPADSLFRFETFLSIEKQLQEMDYLFFFNANMQFRQEVGPEFIPQEEHGFMMAIIHPAEAIKKRHPAFFAYERNKKSLAYIPPGEPPYHYYMGGLNGGRSQDFIKMSKILAQNIRDDYDRGIIAKFHDESHLNCYMHQNPPLGLDCRYGHPEGWGDTSAAKIIIRDKVKVDEYFRKQPPGLAAKLLHGFEKLFSAIRWYLKF